MFLAIQASLTSYNSLFRIDIIDKEIQIIILISSGLTLNILSGVHSIFIVSAIPEILVVSEYMIVILHTINNFILIHIAL